MYLQLTPYDLLPLSAVSWGFGSIAVFFFGVKSAIRYLNTRNAMTLYFAWFGAIMGVALGFYGFPAFFTLNLDTLRSFYLTADLLVFAALIVQAKILWYIGFRNLNIFPAMATTIAILGITAWINELYNSVLFIQNNIVKNIHHPLASNLRGAIFALLLLPLGYFFLIKSTKQDNLRGKIKSVALGLAYFLIGISVSITELIYRGADSREGMIANLIVFAIFFIAILWPGGKRAEIKT